MPSGGPLAPGPASGVLRPRAAWAGRTTGKRELLQRRRDSAREPRTVVLGSHRHSTPIPCARHSSVRNPVVGRMQPGIREVLAADRHLVLPARAEPEAEADQFVEFE